MNWTKLPALALLVAALIACPATAHADCGDPGQDPCTGPVPTVDQIVGLMQQLTDPNIPAANKGNIVSPGFSPDEAGTADNHLNRMRDLLPLNFVITDIQPAPNNFAGATISTTGDFHQWSPPGPLVLVEQGGHWLITHHSAMGALDAYWYNANKRIVVTPHT
jgi:hypothetical protein